MDIKAMTVSELIVELQKHDPNKEVYIEGCDCIGFAIGVEEFETCEKLNVVLIIRGD